MEIPKIKSKYRQKGLDSFETRLKLLLFETILKSDQLDSIDELKLRNFKITEEIILKYATQYYQLGYEESVDGKKVEDIWTKMSLWKKTHVELFETLKDYYLRELFEKEIFPFEDFISLFDDARHRECHYCGITEDMIRQLIQKQKLFKKRERGFILEIDRKRPNEEYTMDNSVLCCYWCNNAKTDEFCATEFKAIGEEIGKIWEKRLSK